MSEDKLKVFLANALKRLGKISPNRVSLRIAYVDVNCLVSLFKNGGLENTANHSNNFVILGLVELASSKDVKCKPRFTGFVSYRLR